MDGNLGGTIGECCKGTAAKSWLAEKSRLALRHVLKVPMICFFSDDDRHFFPYFHKTKRRRSNKENCETCSWIIDHHSPPDPSPDSPPSHLLALRIFSLRKWWNSLNNACFTSRSDAHLSGDFAPRPSVRPSLRETNELTFDERAKSFWRLATLRVDSSTSSSSAIIIAKFRLEKHSEVYETSNAMSNGLENWSRF